MSKDKEHKISMPYRAPDIRKHDFVEVSIGYTPEMAKCEAERCLQCKNAPCVSGCPVHVPIADFINEIKNGNLSRAQEVLLSANSLARICGRVCPQEKQCESRCVRGIKGEPISIGNLERYVADWRSGNNSANHNPNKKMLDAEKIAIVGSGPAGLSCASDLATYGYDVTIFEALHKPGGVLTYGIPEFRLPNEVVDDVIHSLNDKGVKILTDVVIGKTLTIDDLFDSGFKAVFVASGAGIPAFMGIPGENLINVYSANEFLTRINLMHAYDDSYDTPLNKPRNVAVIGGGNVAMDAARCAQRLGVEKVYLLYRRSEAEMPARAEEIKHAKEEGVIFKTLSNPIEIIGDESGFVNKVKCVSMQLGDIDNTGRRSVRELEGSEFSFDVDCIVVAIGNTPNPIIVRSDSKIQANKRGGIIVDPDTSMTSRPNVYAGGDAVTGAATVILAMGAGKRAAKSIHDLKELCVDD